MGDTRLTFVVPGKPQGKQRARRGRGGQWYTPKETVVYERAVSNSAMVAIAAGGFKVRYPGPVEVEVYCYFPDARRRDADNALKSVLDGMHGVVYYDDTQVVRATVEKCIDGQRPRTVVVVTYLEEC
jgi:Holliday junction resolvase RusA-like endonuclease